jgi:hypothetical protein
MIAVDPVGFAWGTDEKKERRADRVTTRLAGQLGDFGLVEGA